MSCEEEPVLAHIELDPLTVSVDGEDKANLTLFFLERNEEFELDSPHKNDELEVIGNKDLVPKVARKMLSEDEALF